jgi:26S proteasome regulatory subunit N10
MHRLVVRQQLSVGRVCGRVARPQAQSEAIHLLASHKANDNPENTVGILTLAGKGPRVLVTPTSDLGKILGAMHGLGMEGETHVCSGMQVAQLALKHRQNKNQRQRVVLFIGSPITTDQVR